MRKIHGENGPAKKRGPYWDLLVVRSADATGRLIITIITLLFVLYARKLLIVECDSAILFVRRTLGAKTAFDILLVQNNCMLLRCFGAIIIRAKTPCE